VGWLWSWVAVGWDIGWLLWDVWGLGWLAGAIGRGNSSGIAILFLWANSSVVGVGLSWISSLSWVLNWVLWGLSWVFGWWDVVVGGVGWWDIVVGGGWDAGGDAVSGGSIDLSWAVGDIVAAAGDGHLLIGSVGDLRGWVLSWGWLVDWGHGGLVWLVSAGLDGGVDLVVDGGVDWLFGIETSKGARDGSGRGEDGSETHFDYITI